ncbi:MAG: hypothetical protein ABWZ77_03370 [Naasia sp.]
MKRAAATITSLVLIAVVSGCAQAPLPAERSGGEATMACPAVPHDSGPRDCSEYDPEQAMEQNQRYKQQREISAETSERLQANLGPVREALESLPEPPTPEAVTTAFTDLGLGMAVQTDDNGNAVRFGVAAGDGGCITGYVGYDGVVAADHGGTIEDGGCLVMSGH